MLKYNTVYRIYFVVLLASVYLVPSHSMDEFFQISIKKLIVVGVKIREQKDPPSYF